MRILTGVLLTCGLLAVASLAVAQRPGGLREGPPESAADFVARMMEFDADKDGRLTKGELTETRLHRLFDRADADEDGVVTKQELTDLAARELTNDRGGPPGGGPRGPMMAPPRPGEILPAMLRRELRLTDEQTNQLDELQKDVDAKLAIILTDDQEKTLQSMRRRGPGGDGPGRPGGPPGRGRPERPSEE